MRRLAPLSLLGLSLLGLWLWPSPAAATWPGRDGQIAFDDYAPIEASLPGYSPSGSRAQDCTVPVGESSLGRHGSLRVWEDPTVPGGGSGSIYACSARHPVPVKLLTAPNSPCPSPTGCYDWDHWGFTEMRVAGDWVAVAASSKSGPLLIGLWDSAGKRPARVVANVDATLKTSALALRADGALAYAYSTVDNAFNFVDLLYACGSGCLHVSRLDTFRERGRSRLADVRFGGHDSLQWRDGTRSRTVVLR
jgi:hypothetical protein